MNQEEKEVTINIADMCAYLLHRWRTVLIWGIVFMVLVGGLMSFKEYRGIKSKYKNETFSVMMDNLTENQQNNVKNYYSRYENYKKRIEENQNYIDNSYLMDINPNNVSEYTVEYLVKTGYPDIMSSFVSSSFDYEDYEKMAAIIGNGTNAGYISEIVILDGKVQQDAYEIDTDKVGDVVNGNISNSYTGILQLQIKAENREICEKLAETADGAIKEHLEKIKKAGINAEISNLTSVYMQKEDLDLSDYQRKKIDEGAEIVNGYYKFISDADKTLDENELSVFKYMIDKDQEVSESVNWKKWIALGFVIGFVLSAAIILANYLFIPGIKTFDEAEVIMDEKEIGVVIQPAKSKLFLGKIFHNLANKLEYREITQLSDIEAISLVCNRIEVVSKGNNSKNVYLIHDIVEGYTKEVIDKCVEILTSKGLYVKSGNPGGVADDFVTLSETTNLVAFFAITNKSSLPNSIKNNVLVCKENGIQIGGDFIISPQR